MYVCRECGSGFDRAGLCVSDGSPLELSSDPLLGAWLSRWRLARLLGVGGMGRVYLGVQPEIGSRVAVKVLSDECAHRQDMVERFFAEARAVNLIRHEHIVSVLDLARFDDGRPYIVMEFIEGATLAAHAAAGPIPLGPLCAIFNEVLAALSAAHAIGIIHRDLKPDNVLVTRAGHAKVLDFGVAKLAPNLHQSPRTRTGAVLGTPFYMAPEQVAGEAVDGRSDLYALGIMLYELTTGRRPFTGENVYLLMRAQLEDTPPPPRTLRPDLLPAIEQVILRAMAKSPDQRFRNAADMAAALSQAAAALPSSEWGPLPVHAATWPPARTQAVPSPRQLELAATEPSVPDRRWPRWPLAAVGVGAAIAAGIWVGTVVRPRFSAAPASAAPSIDAAPAIAIASAPPPPPIVASSPGAQPSSQPSAQPSPTTADERRPTPSTPERAVRSAHPAGAPAGSTSPPTSPPAPALPAATHVGANVISGGDVVDDPDGGRTIYQAGSKRLSDAVSYDAHHFDALAFLPRARELAQRLMPDAELTAIDVDGVKADGRADLTLESGFEASYRFRSTSRSQRPADLPKNIEMFCIVTVDADARKITTYTVKNETCKEPFLRKPRCSFAAVWKRMLDRGADAGNVATLQLDASGWSTEAGDFDESFADGC